MKQKIVVRGKADIARRLHPEVVDRLRSGRGVGAHRTDKAYRRKGKHPHKEVHW